MTKKIKYLIDGVRDGKYIRAWKEKRDYAVQVWLNGECEGKPDGDWGMPGVLGLETSVGQAVLQTKELE